MNLFETVKAAVSVRMAAEYYGLQIGRNNMTCCPFHNDRHPSMKLNQDYFYCFGGGAAGDVIELVSRLFNLSAYEAAEKLADDFGIDPDRPPEAAALKKPEYLVVKALQKDELYCQRILCDYLRLLERWDVNYAPKTPEDEIDDRFVEVCQMMGYIENLADILTVGEAQQKAKVVEMLMKDDTIKELEQRINILKKQDKDYGEEYENAA